MIAAGKVIGVYGMGLTQHTHGALNIAMLVNLLLLRGNIGRPGAGCCPVRGHSNVQGQRTVGIAEKVNLVPLDKLRAMFGFEPPTEDGMNIVEAVEGPIALTTCVETVVSVIKAAPSAILRTRATSLVSSERSDARIR